MGFDECFWVGVWLWFCEQLLVVFVDVWFIQRAFWRLLLKCLLNNCFTVLYFFEMPFACFFLHFFWDP